MMNSLTLEVIYVTQIGISTVTLLHKGLEHTFCPSYSHINLCFLHIHRLLVAVSATRYLSQLKSNLMLNSIPVNFPLSLQVIF